ncbi:MAG: HypC/HybG/HupF family hydrogenase formation chaperone [Actinocatenispora sp.]
MCIGIPGRVTAVSAENDLADVEVSGVVRGINVGLLSDDPPAPGDWILIHSGFALSRMTEEEARDAMAFLVEISEAYERELAAPSLGPVPLPGE